MNTKPKNKPVNPSFSSGPCPKYPGWNVTDLQSALVGRSHRSVEGKEKLRYAIELTKKILQIPDEYLVGIVPASDTGGGRNGLVEPSRFEACRSPSLGKFR